MPPSFKLKFQTSTQMLIHGNVVFPFLRLQWQYLLQQEISNLTFNPLTPKIWLLILPSSCCTFPCSYENLVLDQDSILYLISLNILITCLLNKVRMLWGEVSCWSLLGVKGLILFSSVLCIFHYTISSFWIIFGQIFLSLVYCNFVLVARLKKHNVNFNLDP